MSLLDAVKSAKSVRTEDVYGTGAGGQAALRETVRLDALDTRFQSRARTHKKMVLEIRKRIQGGKSIDPMLAWNVDGTLFLTRGFHRLEAYQAEGIESVLIEIKEGTEDDAFDDAMLSNAAHGTPLDDDDRRHKLRMWYERYGLDRSANEAARQTDTLPQLAAEVRAEMLAEAGQEDTGQRTYTRNGQEVRMQVSQKPFASAAALQPLVERFIAHLNGDGPATLERLAQGDKEALKQFRDSGLASDFRVRGPSLKNAAAAIDLANLFEGDEEPEPDGLDFDDLDFDDLEEVVDDEEPEPETGERLRTYSAPDAVWARVFALIEKHEPELAGQIGWSST